jgi:hypothetical protein
MIKKFPRAMSTNYSIIIKMWGDLLGQQPEYSSRVSGRSWISPQVLFLRTIMHMPLKVRKPINVYCILNGA